MLSDAYRLRMLLIAGHGNKDSYFTQQVFLGPQQWSPATATRTLQQHMHSRWHLVPHRLATILKRQLDMATAISTPTPRIMGTRMLATNSNSQISLLGVMRM